MRSNTKWNAYNFWNGHHIYLYPFVHDIRLFLNVRIGADALLFIGWILNPNTRHIHEQHFIVFCRKHGFILVKIDLNLASFTTWHSPLRGVHLNVHQKWHWKVRERWSYASQQVTHSRSCQYARACKRGWKLYQYFLRYPAYIPQQSTLLANKLMRSIGCRYPPAYMRVW